MSSINTNGTEISADRQNRDDAIATTSLSDNESFSNNENKSITEMSSKQLQAITFVSKTNVALENCLKQEHLSDCKELQNVIKNLAIVLKNGEKETKENVIEALNKDDNKILLLLDKIAFRLFKGMQSYMYFYKVTYSKILCQ